MQPWWVQVISFKNDFLLTLEQQYIKYKYKNTSLGGLNKLICFKTWQFTKIFEEKLISQFTIIELNVYGA